MTESATPPAHRAIDQLRSHRGRERRGCEEVHLALCFEIIVNDDAPVLAGLNDMSVLTAMLTFVASHNDLELHAGGME